MNYCLDKLRYIENSTPCYAGFLSAEPSFADKNARKFRST